MLATHFVTTPIFYVNSSPHIGHLYSALIADAYCRWHKVICSKYSFIFSTGTDEHGSKIVKAAQSRGLSSICLCNKISQEFRTVFTLSDIQFSAFVRTSDSRHVRTVNAAWNALKNQGLVEMSKYAGWYSIADECFYNENQVSKTQNDEIISKETGTHCEWISENNYVLDMTKFKNEISNWISNESIKPSLFIPQIRKQLENLNKFSLSRPTIRCPWGVPVPFDTSQTTYVWFDALLNYLTAAGYPDNVRLWPPTHQIIGKDIIKFHAIFWPAILLALDMELPRKLICHGHWLIESKKMSKSAGNSVDPIMLIDKYTSDGLRYALLRCGLIDVDNNFCEEKFISVLNAELSNTLGNLLSRCFPLYNPTVVYMKYSDYSYTDLKLESFHKNVCQKVAACFEEFDFSHGIVHVMDYLRYVNLFFHQCAPWTKKDDEKLLIYVLYNVFEALRKSAILLQPVIPNISTKLLDVLAVPLSMRSYANALENNVCFSHSIRCVSPLFPRLKHRKDL